MKGKVVIKCEFEITVSREAYEDEHTLEDIANIERANLNDGATSLDELLDGVEIKVINVREAQQERRKT